METNAANKSCLRLAGIVLSGGFGLILGIAILCAVYPQWGFNHFFSSVCHQQPHRSHQLEGSPMGVCIRCFWLYFGLFIGHARFALFQHIPQWIMQFLILSGALAGLDWISGWWMASGNPVEFRIFTSTLIGIAISHFTTPGVASLIEESKNSFKKVEIKHEYK